MAIITANLVNHKPIRSARLGEYLIAFTFETNNTSAPDGLSPAIDGITLARSGVGDYTITFDEDKKPYAVHFCMADFVEDAPGWHVKYTGYTQSTGVLTLTATDEDNTSGIEAAADSTDQTIQVLILATRSDKS
jgi:hypothetical protein